MKIIQAQPGDSHWQEWKTTYQAAFPFFERIPLGLLTKRAQSLPISLYHLIDGDQWIGLACCSQVKDMVCLQYLAIPGEHQGQGYGSQALTAISQAYPDCRFILNAEWPDPSLEDYDLRRKRLGFYQKNGWTSLGFISREFGYDFLMLGKGQTISAQEYLILRKAFYGRTIHTLMGKKIRMRW